MEHIFLFNNYDLFIFDFDGTIIDSEKYHCLAWNKALNDVNLNINITLSEYFQYFHTLNNSETKSILKLLYKIDNYDTIYKKKQYYYNEIIHNHKNIDLIDNVIILLNNIIQYNKKFIIVTNTALQNINYFKTVYPILKEATKIYTKEDFFYKKPHPECYLKVCNDFKNERKIGFEDSLPGFHSLYQVKDITPVLIYNKNYYYTDYIIQNYNNIIISTDYNIQLLDENLIKNHNNLNLCITNDSNLYIENILNHNINQLNYNFNNMKNIINYISITLNNINSNNNIYLSGMGKSGYICKKCASTWQSLSIKAFYIDLPNLPHGDFGIFKDNDVLLLISNGGNTTEVIDILKYIKEKLNIKINIISIIANKNSVMEKYSNSTYILDNITEADNINMTPSTSSLIFMSILDGIAINMKKNISKDEFKINHPSGSLGKR